jgi:hypothetical protein
MEIIDVPLKAELQILELDLVKEYRKLRLKGSKNNYYLIELPKPFVNGNYDSTKAYAISVAVNKANNHKCILIDLDEHKPVLSMNNRRCEK